MPSIIWIRQLGGREAEYGSGKDRRRSREWLVLTDSRYYDEGKLLDDGIALGTFPTPYFSTHPDDGQFLCKKLSARQETNAPTFWKVRAMWDTVPAEGQEEEEKPPLDRAAKISWSTVKYQKAVERDREGLAIFNSAGYPFDPPPLKDISRWTCTVRKNISEVPGNILTWKDAVNSGTFSIDGLDIEANVAKIMGIAISELQKEDTNEYRILQYTLEFDPVDKWKGKYLNIGFYDSDGERIKDESGKNVVSPWPLDDDGYKITTPTTANATFEEYDIEDEMDFSVLPTV